MRTLAQTLTLACCALLLPGLGLAAESAAPAPAAGELLKRMSNAAHALDYDGTFIYEQNGQMQTIRIIHSADGGVERERMVTLSGPSREVLRDDKSVTCILGERSPVVVDSTAVRPTPLSISPDVERLAHNYELTTVGRDRIAEKEVVRVSIRPRDLYRFGIDFWVDESSGLMLKSELVDQQNQVIERLLFTAMKVFDRLPADLLQPQTKGKGMVSQPGPAAAPPHSPGAASVWEIAQLPAGFKQEMVRHHRMPGREQEVEHRVFSDGLASVSVFIEPHASGGDSAFVGSSGMGAVNAYARLVGRYLVTVVGEVPPATVQYIGEGIRLAGGQ